MTNGKHKARKEAGPLRSRIVGEGTEAPDQLLANPLNWRTHPREQVDALEGLLREVGWVQRVIVNRTTGHIVDGHARVELALRRGEAAVPVLYVELSEAEERLVLAALDPIGGLAGADADKLAELLADVQADDAGLLAMLDGLIPKAPEVDAGPAEDPGGGSYSEQYGVIVMCRDAAEQERVYNRLKDDGYECKVVCT